MEQQLPLQITTRDGRQIASIEDKWALNILLPRMTWKLGKTRSSAPPTQQGVVYSGDGPKIARKKRLHDQVTLNTHPHVWMNHAGVGSCSIQVGKSCHLLGLLSFGFLKYTNTVKLIINRVIQNLSKYYLKINFLFF